MWYYFLIHGEKICDSDLRALVEKAEEIIAVGQAETIEIFVVDNENGDENWLIDIPTKNPEDEPFLTKDWIACYTMGCRFASLKNRNEPFCGKLRNPKDVHEQRTTPVNCPVTYPKWYRQEKHGFIKTDRSMSPTANNEKKHLE